MYIYINIYVSIYLYIYLSLYLSVNLFKNLSSFSSLSLYRISVLFVLLLILSPISSTGVATGTVPPPHLWEVKNHDSQGFSPQSPNVPKKSKTMLAPLPLDLPWSLYKLFMRPLSINIYIYNALSVSTFTFSLFHFHFLRHWYFSW